MTLLPTRKVISAFVGVFLIGALVGGLVVLTFQDVRFSHFLSSTADPKSMAARIKQKYIREYDLSPDEQARIAPLTQEMAQRLYVTRRQFGVDILATLDDYHRKVGEQMTPEHRQAFEQANKQRRERISAMFQLDQNGADADSR